ncbi:MAG TPA: POTRA domain-containing protein, partial [Candidatus Limnocylindria bacterium]|nr:POTRA domain-containing protein [Candidatus Limnocylindria bacterium]
MRANLISLRVSAGKLALAVLLAGILAMPALPLQQPAKGKIAQIKFEGLRKYSEAQMDELSGLHPGDVAGREDLQAAADRLAQAGLFTNVSYRFQSSGEELRVTFRVEEAPTVPVLFDNIPWYTDGELIGAIRNGLPWFDGTAPQQGPFLEQMASAVQKLLDLRGLHVAVEHELTNDPASDALAQVFRVTGA